MGVIKKIIILLIILSSSLICQFLKLEDYLKLGKENNLKIKSLENIVLAKKSAYKQASVKMNPSFEVEAGNKEQYVSLFQGIEYPGKIDSRMNLAEAELNLAEAELNSYKNELDYQLFTDYVELIFSKKTVDLLKDYYGLILELNKITKYNLDKGFGNKLDVIKSKVELVRAERNLVEAEKKYHQLIKKIKTNISDSFTDSLITLSDDEIKIKDFLSEEEAYSLALKFNANILVEKNKIKIAEANSQNVIISKKPDFNIGLKTGFDEGYFATSISFGMPINLWDNKEGAIEESIHNKNSSEREYDNVVKSIKQEIGFLLIEIKNLRNTINLYEKELLFETKEEYNNAKRLFQAGELRLLDFLDAQKTCLDVNLEYIEVKKSLLLAKANLNSVIGISLLEK